MAQLRETLLNALAFLFVWRFLPELKGRSLEEVEEAVRQNQFTPQHFADAPNGYRDSHAAA
jgi:hypothetical protein